MSQTSTTPDAVFRSIGLFSKGGWSSFSIPLDEDGSGDIPLALCGALDKLGGLYSAFGAFLRWRADLLDSRCIERLRSINAVPPPVSLDAAEAILRRELGRAAIELTAHLEAPPLWNTMFRTAWISEYMGQRVVVEVAHTPVSERQLTAFECAMGKIRHPDAAAIASETMLAQFREWLRNGESLSRERSFLEVLSDQRAETLAGYPIPIAALSTPSVLCWPAVGGRSALELVNDGDPRVSPLVATAVLEQFYSLSMIDADLELEGMIVDRENRLHFRRLNNVLAVPPSLVNYGIKYISSVLAGNASVSAQTLIRLVVSHPPLNLERRLMDAFSGVDPELKINRWFPNSAGVFESNWRALAKVAPRRPLFLDCLHRNLLAAGYWNSDAARAGAPVVDAMAVAEAPVVARLLRTQFGMVMNQDTMKEWALGSGLLMFGSFREMNRLVEEIRENDVTVGVDMTAPIRPTRKRRSSKGLVLAGVLVILLLCLLLGASAPEPWHGLLRILALGALPATFWAARRMGAG